MACPYVEQAPRTGAGMVAWAVVRRCGAQVRVSGSCVYGLDFGAVLAMAAAMGADTFLLADVLPEIEAVIIHASLKAEPV